MQEDKPKPAAAKPAPAKKSRAAAEPSQRNATIKAIADLRNSSNYNSNGLSDIARSIAVITAIDFYRKTPSSFEGDNAWGAMLALAAANQVPPTDCGVTGFNLCTASNHVAALTSRFQLLVQRVCDADREVAAFRDTFLKEAESVVVVGRDESIDAAAPVRCEMVRALLPADQTKHVIITYAAAVKTKPQTVCVAAKFAPLVQKLVFVARLPAALYEVTHAYLIGKKNIKHSHYVAGETKIASAIERTLSVTSKGSLAAELTKQINGAFFEFLGTPKKFDVVRKTILKDVLGMSQPAAAAVGDLPIEFEADERGNEPDQP